MIDHYNIEQNGEVWLLERLAQIHPAMVFDVGANIGDWTRHARRLMPEAEIHAFEIAPETTLILRQRVGDLDRVVINDCGMADRSGEIVVHCGKGGSVHSSILGEFVPEVEEVRNCRVVAGDDYMRENAIGRVDLLKIDAESSDHLVMAGFRTAMRAGTVDVIQFEYGRGSIITHFLLYDFYRLLESNGYVVGQLNPTDVEFKPYTVFMEGWWPPNWIAVRKEREDIMALLRP